MSFPAFTTTIFWLLQVWQCQLDLQLQRQILKRRQVLRVSLATTIFGYFAAAKINLKRLQVLRNLSFPALATTIFCFLQFWRCIHNILQRQIWRHIQVGNLNFSALATKCDGPGGKHKQLCLASGGRGKGRGKGWWAWAWLWETGQGWNLWRWGWGQRWGLGQEDDGEDDNEWGYSWGGRWGLYDKHEWVNLNCQLWGEICGWRLPLYDKHEWLNGPRAAVFRNAGHWIPKQWECWRSHRYSFPPSYYQ